MELIGKIVSTKMNKTVVVAVDRLVIHPIYKKRTHQSKRYKVHDSLGVKMGDLVKIESTRPISKTKHFKVVEVLKK